MKKKLQRVTAQTISTISKLEGVLEKGYFKYITDPEMRQEYMKAINGMRYWKQQERADLKSYNGS